VKPLDPCIELGAADQDFARDTIARKGIPWVDETLTEPLDRGTAVARERSQRQVRVEGRGELQLLDGDETRSFCADQ
jgi:hypothetical protein